MSDKNQSGLFVAGLLIGGAIGTIVGTIIAPRSGKETRRLLKKTAQALPELAEDVSSSVQEQAHRLSTEAQRNWEDTLNRLKEAIAAGVEASQLAQQQLETPNEAKVDSNSADIHS